MKDELGGQTMKEFVGLRTKTYSSLKENNEYKKCVIKRKLKLQKLCRCSKIDGKVKYLEKKGFNIDKLLKKIKIKQN